MDKQPMMTGGESEVFLPISNPRSMARFMAHPPIPRTITYMQKLSTRSREATGFICSPAIFPFQKYYKSGRKEEEKKQEREKVDLFLCLGQNI